MANPVSVKAFVSFEGEATPLDLFRAEQMLKSEDVIYPCCPIRDRRHEVGAFARVLHEVKALLKKVRHEVKAWCKKVSAA